MNKVVLAALAATIPCGSVQAAVYAYDISGSRTNGVIGPITGYIVFTTNDILNPDGSTFVTAVSGNFDGYRIEGLIEPGGYLGNDNLLFPNLDNKFDINGVSFANGNNIYNIYYISTFPKGIRVAGFGGVNLTPAVPEPASWAMMVAGFGLAGAAMRRRRVSVSCA